MAKAMVVGTIEGQENIKTLETHVTERFSVNEKDFTFCLKTYDDEPTDNFRHWCADLDMLGRHYLVWSSERPHIRRHYTMCHTMIPTFFNAIQ